MLKLIFQGINFLFGRFLQRKGYFAGKSLNYLGRKRDLNPHYLDYVRLASLELAAAEISGKGLKGAVAELGVYKGKFARFINQYFRDRTLYLFDTFEGFDKRDITAEKKNNYSSGEQDFSDTSVEKVLSIMPFPDMCKPVKGFFPASASGMDEQFVFVSIDTDLYDPIYNGLVYFYPRLAKGGYIFIHDFNNNEYKGAKQAVYDFCLKEGISFVALPDSAGSAIIAK